MTGICERLRAMNLVALPHFNTELGIHLWSVIKSRKSIKGFVYYILGPNIVEILG